MHWTYGPIKEGSDLEQGDILSPTPELLKILEVVHPHFHSAKYLAFAVATQSCDLVRRPQSKARYISIASVRSLPSVLPRLLRDTLDEVGPNVYRKSARDKAKQMLDRVLDQNEQALGLFYLHADGDIGIGQPSVVFLRVTVALQAQHYDVLVRARRGRLDPEFRAKFGWLVGNLYARAATPDWADHENGKRTRDEIIARLLDGDGMGAAAPCWVEDELVIAAREAQLDLTSRPFAEVLPSLEKIRPAPRIDQIADVVCQEAERALKDVLGEERQALLTKLRNRLLNSGRLKKLARV